MQKNLTHRICKTFSKLVAILLFCVCVNAQNNVSPEERLIRLTYKKASIYEVTGRIERSHRPRQPFNNGLFQQGLRFKLDDFHIGGIQEIQNKKFTELVTLPNGEIVQLTSVNTEIDDVNRNIGNQFFSLNAIWTPGKYASGMDPQITFVEIFRLDPLRYKDFRSYASYQVTVFLDGKSRTYRAIALFKPLNQSDINSSVEILDTVVGLGGNLTQVFRENKLPIGTKIKQNNEKPQGNDESTVISHMLASWSCEVKWYPGCGVDNCIEWYMSPLDPYGFCLTYDGGGGIFSGGDAGGDGGSNLSCDYELNYDTPDAPKYDANNDFHVSGNHLAYTRFQSSCSVETDCSTKCNVDIIQGPVHDDTGILNELLYYHVGNNTVTRNTRQGPKDAVVPCETAVGYAFQRCFFDCGVKATMGISGHGGSAQVSVEGGDLWNVGHIKGRDCKNGH